MRFKITHLLPNHIDRILNATVGNNRHHRSVDDAQIANSMDAEFRINNALVDALG